MLKYFKYSFLVSAIGLTAGYFWGEKIAPGSGLKALFIVFMLSILEVTLSFDNAVINAIRLEKMNDVWRKRFLTWGILIAVFGMRLVFPVLIVAVFSNHSMLNVFKMALYDITEYTKYLHAAHIPLVTFGGIFLLMIFLSFFFNKKDVFWIPVIEKGLAKAGNINSAEIILSLAALIAVQHFVPAEQKVITLLSGVAAIIIFLIINDACELLEGLADKKEIMGFAGKMGFVNFLYLELIDASFSLDGLLGAFAISKDIIIITIGLAVGAMFVRSLTIFMVDKNALQKYIYLANGAHWAIGTLAVIMLLNTKISIPEVFTGLASLVIISAALASSLFVRKNKNN